MDIYKRVENLENLVNGLVETLNDNKFYTDADIAGARQSISNITPYEDSKTAYIGDTEIVFENVPDGKLSVFVKDSDGNYPDFTVERAGGTVTVAFVALEFVTDISISVI